MKEDEIMEEKKKCNAKTRFNQKCRANASIGSFCIAHYHIIKKMKKNKMKELIWEENYK